MSYDSTAETLKHIRKVQANLNVFVRALTERGEVHDESKLGPEEKPYFDKYTQRLKGLTYGSKEYKDNLKQLKPAIEHHNKNNSHHPEHYVNGIKGFDLLDLVEMFCDWKAATERHEDGCLMRSIEHNKERFDISDQLSAIPINTAKRLKWRSQ